MLNNDPTKNGFYHRCPLFGDLLPIYNIPETGKLDLFDCLEIVNEARVLLIMPFLPPSTRYYTRNYAYFYEDPYPDPQIVEDRISYPAALLKSFRVIYWRAYDIEVSCFINAGRLIDEAATTINEDEAVEGAKNTIGVELAAKQIIDSKMIFRLFAIKEAMNAIRYDLVDGESISEPGLSRESFIAAKIYLKRASDIEAREKVISEKEVAKEAINQLNEKKRKRDDQSVKIATAKAIEKKERREKALYLVFDKYTNKYSEFTSMKILKGRIPPVWREQFYSEAVHASREKDPFGKPKDGEPGYNQRTIGRKFNEYIKKKFNTYPAKP